jgi:F-type H+-transporting ATPase subunit alpha
MTPDADYRNGLLERQAAWLAHYRPGLRITEQGRVVSVGDGIAWIAGLPSASMDDVLAFEDGSRAMVFDLTEALVGAVLLHETAALAAGTIAHPSARALSLPVGDNLLGRVIDPLGLPLDQGPAPDPRLLPAGKPPRRLPPRHRARLLYTGIKRRHLVPVGSSQLIGDRTGPQLDRHRCVLNQRGKGLLRTC